MSRQANQEFYAKMYASGIIEQDTLENSLFYANHEMARILQQVAIEVTTALELGSGIGIDAMALAQKGVAVTALELDPTAHHQAVENQLKTGTNVEFKLDNFMEYSCTKKFDLVYYKDGFGVGEDSFQQKLLQRVTDWLEPNGRFYVDVYNPNFWQQADQVEMQLSDTIRRRYAYNQVEHNFSDTWYDEKSGEVVKQTLKCYDLATLEQLAKKANLKILAVYPSGKINYQLMQWENQATLADCMYYQVVMGQA